MKHKILRFFLDFEKEEKWLNEMSAKGLHFVSYCFPQYVFEEGQPGEYIYRLEMLDHLPSHPESKVYINFVEETGVECVDTMLQWAYFRKKTSDGLFDMYSDCSSKIKHYKRIIALIGAMVAVNVAIGLYCLGTGVLRANAAVAIPNIVSTAVLTHLLLSYWKRMKKLKDTMKVSE